MHFSGVRQCLLEQVPRVGHRRVARLERFLLGQTQAVESVASFVGSGGPRWYLGLNLEQDTPNYASVIVTLTVGLSSLPSLAQCTFDWKPGESPQGLSYEGYAMAVYDDGDGPALYVAGGFETAGGIKACGIARWDGRYWSSVGGGVNKPSGCGQVKALVVHDGELVAGGCFTTAGDATASIASFNSRKLAVVIATPVSPY